MYDNSKLFEKFKLNNGVEVPSRLGVPPMTLFCQNQMVQLMMLKELSSNTEVKMLVYIF